MRILYCTPESPNFPRGNPGVYLRFALNAMSAAGHEVFVFTWKRRDALPESEGLFPSSRLCTLEIDPAEVEQTYPAGPLRTALSHILSPHIARCVDQ